MVGKSFIGIAANDFLQLPPNSYRMELINGEVITDSEGNTMQSSSIKHQQVVVKLLQWLGSAIQTGFLFTAPLSVSFDKKHVFQPDIGWVAADNTNCIPIDGQYLQGAPDLIIEVLSSGTIKRDRGIKFTTYERHGVREYWLVDTHERFIEIFHYQNNHFIHQGIYSAGDSFNSPVLATTLTIQKVFD